MQSRDRVLSVWLFTVCFFVATLVIFGGYVRLTRSGLSMVEWHVITGMVPPIGETAWQEAFAKYQLTPEFAHVNSAMSVGEYRTIYYNEYLHRMLGRFTGLLFVLPLAWFMMRGRIPWRRSRRFVAIALLFALQGFMGWFMVRSGLIDRPSVSHLRLMSHLLAALALFGLCWWTGLSLWPGTVDTDALPLHRPPDNQAKLFKLSLLLTTLLVVQIAYGALVAGLKAGYASDTFPLMFGHLIPPGLLSTIEPAWRNLFETPATVHFVHRWFAFAVLLCATLLLRAERRRPPGGGVRRGATTIVGLIAVQILLGISVIWFHVPVAVALLHQATALLLLAVALFLNHRLAPGDAPAASTQATGAA